jgi:hypothetical protein
VSGYSNVAIGKSYKYKTNFQIQKVQKHYFYFKKQKKFKGKSTKRRPYALPLYGQGLKQQYKYYVANCSHFFPGALFKFKYTTRGPPSIDLSSFLITKP